MADLSLVFGGDLAVSPTGDLLLSDQASLTQQRVLRRLLTSAGDYIWQLQYGAGLGAFVGAPGAAAVISGIVRTQMLQETAVAATPPPVVTATATDDSSVNLSIQYADIKTNGTNNLSFSL